MANRFAVASGNWNDNNNWAATSGGTPGASFPVAGDVVAFDSLSGNANITVNVASACASLVVSGTYTGTLTFNAALVTTSTVTFIAGMTIAGTAGTLQVNTGNTITSGGKTLTCNFTCNNGGGTLTLGDSWTVNGVAALGNSASQQTYNGNTLTCAGGITLIGVASTVIGTTLLKMTGGTLQTTNAWTTGSLKLNLNFDGGANTLTVSGTLRYSGGTITYVSGTMSMGTSILVLSAASTLNTNGMTWPNYQPVTSITVTMTSDFQATDIQWPTFAAWSGNFVITCATMTTQGTTSSLTISGNLNCTGLWTDVTSVAWTQGGAFDITAGSCTMSGTKTITLTRDITITGTTTSSDANVINGAFNWKTGGLTTTGALTGTATMLFNGTGTWTGAAAALSMNTTINTAGTLTLSGTILFAASGTPTLTWIAGTVSRGSSILSIASSCTLNTLGGTSGMLWQNITLTAALTLTINALLQADGTLTLPNAAVTFAGTDGFIVNSLTTATITAARTYTMASGETYEITNSFTVTGLVAGHVIFAGSAAAGTKANIVLDGPASQSLGYVDATDIDSSAGQSIYTFGGTLTRTVNWNNTSSSSRVGLNAVGHAG